MQSSFRPYTGQADPEGNDFGKVLSPSCRRMAVMHVRQTLGASERRSCRVISQHRFTQRKKPQGKVDEDLLTADIIKLARAYGRYG